MLYAKMGRRSMMRIREETLAFVILFFSCLALGSYESAPHIIVFMADDLVRY